MVGIKRRQKEVWCWGGGAGRGGGVLWGVTIEEQVSHRHSGSEYPPVVWLSVPRDQVEATVWGPAPLPQRLIYWGSRGLRRCLVQDPRAVDHT